MSHFVTTPLGRDVPGGDWVEYRKDQVLDLLYDFQRSPFNDGTLSFGLASICNATRLSPPDARVVVDALVASGLAEEPTAQAFRITPKGLLFVQTLRPAARTGSP